MEPVPVTHTVFNQTPPLGAYNRYATDLGLQSAVHRAGAAEWDAALRAAGAEIGSAVNLEDARLANRQPPLLQSSPVCSAACVCVAGASVAARLGAGRRRQPGAGRY